MTTPAPTDARSLHRWVFTDSTETYTVPINPNKMSKIRGSRTFTTKNTTGITGTPLVFEGQQIVQALTFSGVILAKVHYDDLNHWVYDKGPFTITDHLGRVLSVILQDIDSQSVWSITHPYRMTYSVTGLCFSVNEAADFADAPNA